MITTTPMLEWVLMLAWAGLMALLLYGAVRLACCRWYFQPRTPGWMRRNTRREEN
jgi:hypothetical protein